MFDCIFVKGKLTNFKHVRACFVLNKLNASRTGSYSYFFHNYYKCTSMNLKFQTLQ